ncbi:MFS transporter [Nostoc sp. CCY 9925]|uniref:MFS transporter n=1 Tax=Nostoc sp. CCY 9925 TaxID=3103865 RepID=UPI0039C66221
MKRPALIVATAIFLITHAGNLQVPLYNTYAQIAGFGSGISAVAFSTYVAGLLPTLILLGGISDRIGRKTTILASLLSASLATLLMIVYPTIYTLFVTRIFQGIAVGLITGTGTAYLSVLMPRSSAIVATYVSLTTSLGFSSGALFTNAALFYNNSLVPLSYWVIFILTLGCIGFAIAFLPEQPVSKSQLIRLPIFPDGTIPAGLAIALAWSLAGIVSIILPAQLVQYNLPNWSGPILFIFVIAGVLFQPLARKLKGTRSLQLGCILLVLGYIVFTFGAWLGILGLVLTGVALAGTACYGFTYLGGLAEVVRLSDSQSARAVSGYFVCAYLGYGLPVIFIGFFADRIGILNALLGFGAILFVSNILLAGMYQRANKKSA